MDISGAEALPDLLSETGLYSNIGFGLVSEAAVEFTPRFPLWTDGATKRRWLLLPDGGQVDTQDSGDWRFPVGTRTFKEFTRDGIRIETRMNVKTESGWAAVAYTWNAAGDDASRQTDGVENAAGTRHDVPGAAECLACHGGRRNFTLGFSATQLDRETRARLHEAGVLSHAVETELSLGKAVLAGLGVLHGNCSHCHNATRSQQAQATDCYTVRRDFDFTLPPDLTDVVRAPAFATARKLLGTADDSEVLKRISRRDDDDDRPAMPPLGTEEVDEEGVRLVRTLLEALAQE